MAATDLLPSGRYDPQWTEPEYGRGGARDDLGIETLSESILAELLPGINNQTTRARYYSFWAWALRDFIFDEAAEHTRVGFQRWARRREDALVLACLAHGCGTSPAGTTQGNAVWQGGVAEVYPLDWKPLVSADGGSYGLYYSGALQEMHVTQATDDSPHDDLTRPLGLGIADAYGKAIADTAYARHHLSATRLRKADIEGFAERGCLCRVGDHETERRRLIDAFFRFDTPDIAAVRRLVSLGFLLDVIAQSHGGPLDTNAIRSVLYFWSYDDHHGYEPGPNALSAAEGWRIFQLRQYQVFAVECFWSLFLTRALDAPMSGPEYLSRLLSDLDLSALAADYHLDNVSARDPGQLPLEAFYQAVRDALPERALVSGLVALGTDLNEHALYRHIWPERRRLTTMSGCGWPLVMLALMYWRCQPWRGYRSWRYLGEPYASGRLPMEGYLRDVERAFSEGWTLARWVGWLHYQYIWLQHRRVALEKLAARRQEVAQFEVIHEEGDSEPLYRAIGSDEPKMNGPRFPSALSILLDLKVIETNPGGGYGLTSDGVNLLERFKAYSIPHVDTEDDETTDSAATAAG